MSKMNDLYKLTATDAVALLKNRDVSPLDLVEASIERIDMTDAKAECDGDPMLRAGA
jgi:amidase